MAKRKSAKDYGIEWSVEPYRWLYELRDRYTQAVIGVTRSQAIQVKEEGEKWMKDNAPWTDVTGVARDELTVELFFQGEELANYSEGLGVAQRAASKLAKRGQKRAAVAERTAEYQADFVAKGNMIVTLLFRHGSEKVVPYAVWLEVANQGRYGIISRATEYWGRRLIGRIKSNLNLVQFRGKEGDIDYISQKQVYEEYVAGGTTTTGQPIRKRYTKETKWEKRRRRLEYDPQQLAENTQYKQTVSKKPRRRK